MLKSVLVLLLAALAALPGSATGQSADDLEAAVRDAPDGIVEVVFAARPGVWGDGRKHTWVRRPRSDHPGCTCRNGPIRVTLSVQDGTIRSLDTRVGGEPARESENDLGRVSAAAAASFLMRMALDSESGSVAEDALESAVLADSADLWPGLLTISKDISRPSELRKTAIFWLAQEAADEAAPVLNELVAEEAEDMEVREAAIFALSRLPDGRGVSLLLDIARQPIHPRLVRSAFFWLGQSEDPRALALFEQVLTSGG
ncbi:MAG: HEAT repeat domain-containing protein [Gemmatimonadota bacterium]